MKSFDEMTPQEKERLRIVLQGIRDQAVAYNNSLSRLANIVDPDYSSETLEDLDEHFANMPEEGPLTLEHVEEFIDDFAD